MPKFYPPEPITFINQSERAFYMACKSLPDDWHVFYSVNWLTSNNGRQVSSECDFLVFLPTRGYLVIEVKGGSSILLEQGRWVVESGNSRHYLKRSPLLQANESMYFFRDYFLKETRTRFNGVFAAAVAFPFYDVSEDFGPALRREVIISINDLDDLEGRINQILDYYDSSRRLNATQASQFLSLINKRITLAIAAGAFIEVKERELEMVNKVQDAIIDLLYNYREAFIAGGAGTGKTFIAIKKMNTTTGSRLFLSFNYALVGFVKKNLRGGEAMTIDSLLVRLLGRRGNLEESEYLKGLDQVTTPKYDLIVVDEAQDFSPLLAATIRRFLAPGAQLYVFSDRFQNLFGKAENDFGISSPAFLLRHNIRNTKEIHDFINDQTSIGEEVVPSAISGIRPVRVAFKSVDKARDYLLKLLLNLLEREQVTTSSIVILAARRKENTFLADVDRFGQYYIGEVAGSRTIMFRTIQSFKGLESDVVIYLNYPERHDQQMREYVAFSRAKYLLYVLDLP